MLNEKRWLVEVEIMKRGSEALSSAASPVATYQGFDQLVGFPSTAPFD
jgi:hypothetical protein